MDNFGELIEARVGCTKSLHGKFQWENMDYFSGKNGQFQSQTWTILWQTWEDMDNFSGKHRQFQWQTWEDMDNFSGKHGRTGRISVANMDDFSGNRRGHRLSQWKHGRTHIILVANMRGHEQFQWEKWTISVANMGGC